MRSVEENMRIKNKFLGEFACQDDMAIYLEEVDNDFRPPFFRDIDRILYSLAFSRYMDKTQVFTYKDNDHLSKRMQHVLYVSKIARTIGRALGLNEDLIEAASLGHDLGHTPFGHVGERIINDISLKNGCGFFNHNIHSVRLLMDVEFYGMGKNITLQTLDAIMCHNGEIALEKYEPATKTKDEFLKEYMNSYKDKSVVLKMRPMTLEGCVVRISDLIAYLGRDIEDGIRQHLVTTEMIPESIVEVLGSTNKEMVNTFIMDVIENSINKPYIKLSTKIYQALEELKAFNYKYIYLKANSENDIKNLENMLKTLFLKYVNDIKQNNQESNIIRSYLNNMCDTYKKNNSIEQIVIDYLAGMTDEYCLKEYNKYLNSIHNNSEV